MEQGTIREHLLTDYFTTVSQSKYLTERKFSIEVFFYHFCVDDIWYFGTEVPDEATEYYHAYMLEELKVFLPPFFVSGKQWMQDTQSNQSLQVFVCSADPNIHPFVQTQIATPSRELDCVYGMLYYLIDNKMLVWDKPGILVPPLILSINPNQGKIIR